MRLRRIGSIEEANEFLEEYLPVYNERFRVGAVGEADLHRRIPIGIRLDRVLCVKSETFLRNDFTVAYNGKLYQIEDMTRARKVIVEERTDGSMAITYRGKVLKFTEIGERPKPREGPGAYRPAPSKVYRPPREHPRNTYRESTAAHASAGLAAEFAGHLGTGIGLECRWPGLLANSALSGRFSVLNQL